MVISTKSAETKKVTMVISTKSIETKRVTMVQTKKTHKNVIIGIHTDFWLYSVYLEKLLEH